MSLVLRKMYCVETITHLLTPSIHSRPICWCHAIIAMPNLIGLKIQWYSTSNLLSIMEALLLEILAEWWNNCQRYSHTLPRCTCIAGINTPLERHHKSGPIDIIHLLYSGTSKAYSAHWLDCNSKMPVYVPTQYFYRNIEGTIRTASKIRSWQYRQCMA